MVNILQLTEVNVKGKLTECGGCRIDLLNQEALAFMLFMYDVIKKLPLKVSFKMKIKSMRFRRSNVVGNAGYLADY